MKHSSILMAVEFILDPLVKLSELGRKLKTIAVKVTAADTTSLAIRFNLSQVQTPTVPEKI